jgi:hypothetical protein
LLPTGHKPSLCGMRKILEVTRRGVLASALVISTLAAASAKVHVITLGKWIPVQWYGLSDSTPLTLRIRPVLVDGRIKEYVLGSTHEVTDRLFVARRVFRINNALPEDSVPLWQWQRGGWLLVDRVSGRISPVVLPEFDPYHSLASWYRDYAAYCAVGEDGKKTYVVVAELTRRKPVLKKLLSGSVKEDAGPDSICPAPAWQRNPVRVSFEPAEGEKLTFTIRGTAVDLVIDLDHDE